MTTFFKIYCPPLRETPGAKAIREGFDKCEDGAAYNRWLELQAYTDRMQAGLQELQAVAATPAMENLNQEMTRALQSIAKGELLAPEAMESLRTCLESVQNELAADTKTTSASLQFNMLFNMLIGATAIGSFMLCASAMACGPLAVAVFGLAMAALSLIVLLTSVYSIYVEGRALRGSQLKELDAGMTFLATNLTQQLLNDQKTFSDNEEEPELPHDEESPEGNNGEPSASS